MPPMLKLSASSMSINRLKAVRRYQILGTPPEEAFDRITRLASDIFDTPVALLNIATGRRSLWCKSATGWECAGTYIQTPPCEHAMNEHDLTVVEDIATDDRFASCSLAATAPNLRFYAGTPLHAPDGACIGTLCILAPNPRSFSDTDADRLSRLADLTVDLLENRCSPRNASLASSNRHTESRAPSLSYSLQEQAQKFVKLKESVLTNMSHEVRTPLTAMIGFAEILTEELDGPLAEHAAVIYRCGKRLHRTLDSMMRLSKLEGGIYTLNSRPIDLCKVVHSAVESLLKGTCAQEDVQVSIETPSAPVRAYADSEAVARIVTNILDNAIKFTPSSGQVWVRVHTEGFSGACIEVEDTGVGIAESAIPTVFSAFKQESEGISRMYEGIGLGLTIVKGLVEMMRGVVRIESQKGTGTHVAVHLPTAPCRTDHPVS